ncbi:DNA polymerase III subunit beta [Paenibacillus harenae]|uniref:Beta sliding clamp n=1 Tax=Paenibacillus harenae TaxID=306543 RepID=A0ABT9U5E9_PAEHA|nr:DNA polymerase III subunit beta [Paenibacillus harenae]MDQ0113484.1 DNA polymerase-3 subunit beta [Paenibacillus harenae]
MHIEITRHSLHHALQHIAAGLPSRPVQPILAGIKLQADAHRLTLTCSKLTMTLKYQLPSPSEMLTVQQSGSTVVSARYLIDIVRSLPGGVISLRMTENGILHMQSGQSVYRLATMDANEFPDTPPFDDRTSILINNGDLKTIVGQVAFAASTSEARPVLTGVSMTMREGGRSLKLLATDGIRLAARTACIDAEDFGNPLPSIVIEAKHLTDYSKMLTDAASSTQISFGDHDIRFQTNGFSMLASLIPGQFPSTDKLLPPAFGTEIKLDTASFAEAVGRVSLLAGDSRVVGMRITEEGAELFATSPDIGDVTEAVALAWRTGEAITVYFNGKYMKDIVNATESEQLYIRLTGREKPIIIETAPDDDTYYILTPIRSAH